LSSSPTMESVELTSDNDTATFYLNAHIRTVQPKLAEFVCCVSTREIQLWIYTSGNKVHWIAMQAPHRTLLINATSSRGKYMGHYNWNSLDASNDQ